MSVKPNKFEFLKTARQSEEAETLEETSAPDVAPALEEVDPSPALSVAHTDEASRRPKAKPRPQAPVPPRRVGRPSGKRSDGEHVQVTAYIRRDTHLDVKTSLLREQKGRDFSDLVEELLAKWLKSRT